MIKEVLIEETSIYISDGNYASKYPTKDQFLDEGVPFIRANNFSDGRITWGEMRFISDELHASLRKGHLKEGDVLLTTRGNIGNTAYVTKEFEDANINAQLVLLRADNETIDSRYLFYILSSEWFRATALNYASGTAQPQLPIRHLKKLPLRLHDFATQRKIAAILSAYDDLIENNTRRIGVLEEMAQAIYREWFVHFRFPGHEGVRLVDSELGPVPEGWEVVKLGDIAQEARRSIQPDQVDPETRYVGLEHIPRKSIALTDWGSVDQVKSTKLIFNKGEILFGKIRPYFHKVVVAPFGGICSTDTIVILSKKAEHYYLVLGCVSSEHFVDYAAQTSQGTKMPRADWKVLVKYPVALPPPAILSEFSETMKDVVAQIQNLIFRNQNLRQTRDLLLPRLVSGELDLAGLEIEVGI